MTRQRQRERWFHILLLTALLVWARVGLAEAVPGLNIAGWTDGELSMSTTGSTGPLNDSLSNADQWIAASASFWNLGVYAKATGGLTSTGVVAQASARAWDDWTITAPGASPGDPVMLIRNYRLTGSWEHGGDITLYDTTGLVWDAFTNGGSTGLVDTTVSLTQPCEIGVPCFVFLEMFANAIIGSSADFLHTAALQSIGVTDEFGTPITGYSVAAASGGSPAAVPEPATILLLGSGLAGIGAWSRRRFRRPKF